MTASGWVSRVRGGAWLFLILATAAGCSATGRAPAHLDTAARHLQPPPGYAVVYVLRPKFLGQAYRFDVEVNGVWVGATGGSRYIFTVLKPGFYVFQSRAENVASLRLSVQAGHTYYVEQRPLMGAVIPGNVLRLLPPVVGRRRLSRCFLSSAMPSRVLRLAAMATRLPAGR